MTCHCQRRHRAHRGTGRRRATGARRRGDRVVTPGRARPPAVGVDVVGWNPPEEPAPAEGLAARDGVLHLAGESIAQRWTPASKQRIRSSRELGTARLVEGLAQAEPRPRVLISASAVGYYGPE